jgi:hypothetical protein
MKYANDMGPGSMMYIPSFIEIGSDIKILWEGFIHKYTHTHHGNLINLLSFFNKEGKEAKY